MPDTSRPLLDRMQDVMGPLPDRSHLPALDLQVRDVLRRQGYERRTISFANLHAERVTAYLYVPLTLGPREKRPAWLVLHSTGMAGKDIVDGGGPRGADLAFAAELASHGYVVLAPDYPSFGEQAAYDFKHSPYASGTMKAISDNVRCLDLIESLAEVDPARIAALGHSLGGHNALFTAAFDHRLSVVVTSCGWTPFHYYYGGKKLENWAQDRYMPRVRDVYGANPDRMPFDFPELIASLAPRGVFSNSPERDENFDVTGVRLGVAQALPAFEKAGVPGHLRAVYPDYGHDFHSAERRQARDFAESVWRRA